MSSKPRNILLQIEEDPILMRYIEKSAFVFRWMLGNEPELEPALARASSDNAAHMLFLKYQEDNVVRDVTEMYNLIREYVIEVNNRAAEQEELPDSVISLFAEVDLRPELERANRRVVDLRMPNGEPVDMGDERFINNEDIRPLYRRAQEMFRNMWELGHAVFRKYN